ncbi:universal stress protein [Hymenobacter oligotrophus]|uniref:Universal stress protein n=1 Tax=Hymenobacter oligotrophus TaxID=2319843 RepID=A0A3B7QWX6_9BACT|nr:universal stress protein [Hymenobacter oligotrophus]AYA36045.1 universal stress protein [Hymenobacter oligotrophus]
MKNILVPTDFTPKAHNAFEVALQLAQRTGGHITLLHVVDMPTGGGVVSSGGPAGGGGLNDLYAIKLLQVVKHRMFELIAEAQRRVEGVEVQDLIHTSSLDEAILEVIEERNIDLVVMGTEEPHDWTRMFTETTSQRLIRTAPCPVLTVKQPAPDFKVQHIVFASDFSAEADRVVPNLRQIQQAFPEATLHLLDVVPSHDRDAAVLARINDFAHRHQLQHYEPDVIDAPKVSIGIPRFVEQAHADLVVMLTHAHTGLSHLWHNNTAESVAVHAAPPVLTLHT